MTVKTSFLALSLRLVVKKRRHCPIAESGVITAVSAQEDPKENSPKEDPTASKQGNEIEEREILTLIINNQLLLQIHS